MHLDMNGSAILRRNSLSRQKWKIAWDIRSLEVIKRRSFEQTYGMLHVITLNQHYDQAHKPSSHQ